MNVTAPSSSAPAQASCPEEAASFALLDALGVPYLQVQHDPADTMEQCAQISELLQARICKNLLLCNRQQTAFYLLALPEDKVFHTKDLSQQIGSSRLSFVPGERMHELIGCTPGSASVLGLMYDPEQRVRLLIGRALADDPFFACHPCKNDASLRIATKDLLEVVLPKLNHTPTFVTL